MESMQTTYVRDAHGACRRKPWPHADVHMSERSLFMRFTWCKQHVCSPWLANLVSIEQADSPRRHDSPIQGLPGIDTTPTFWTATTGRRPEAIAAEFGEVSILGTPVLRDKETVL